MNTEEQINELLGRIEAEERKQKDLFGQIGQMFYQKYAGTAEEELKVLCCNMKASQVQVLQYQQMIEELNKMERTNSFSFPSSITFQYILSLPKEKRIS